MTCARALSWRTFDVLEDERDGFGIPLAAVNGGVAVSGSQLAGLGWVDASTVAGLLKTLPLEVARAVLDAETGTLASLTAKAYTPPKTIKDFVITRDGACRMWGCTWPA